MEEHKKQFERVETDFTQVKANINNRATLKTVNEILSDMKKMASKEDYKQAKEKIESFIDDLTSFK